jgi:hypothetical protein
MYPKQLVEELADANTRNRRKQENTKSIQEFKIP